EVIKKGNGHVQVSTDTHGQIRVLPPKIAEEILARERERKARTTLLMAITEDHLVKFHKMTDAKEMWEAIKSRFEGLHKGYGRFQSPLSQLKTHGAGVSTEDANQKFFRSLPSFWSQVSLIIRTKPSVDTLIFDDLCNNHRVFKSDVKGSIRSSSSSQNVAFVSSENTSSTNEVNTAFGGFTSSGHNSQKEGSSSYTDDLMYSFFANPSSGPQMDHEDLEQVDEFDLEEMDLKWQVAMISTRLKKFFKKTGRKLHFDAKEPVGFDKSKTEDYALMAYNSSNSGSDTEISAKDESGLGYGGQIHDGVLSYENEVFASVFDSRSSDVEDSLVTGRFAKVKGMHVVPPSMTRNYMPTKSDFGIDESKSTYGPKQSTTSESNAKTSDLDSCNSNSSVETLKSVPKLVANEPKVVGEPKVWQTVKEQHTCSQNPKPNNRDWDGLMSKRIALTSTARKVNTARPKVHENRPRHNVYKSHSPIRRPFNKTTAPKANFAQHKVNNEWDKSVSVVGGKWETVVKASAVVIKDAKDITGIESLNTIVDPNLENDNPHHTLKGKGIIDSGCSRHMTRNKAYLVDYQDFRGGPVAFGGSKGQIIGKDTKCLVLSPDFKLPDENQVLLRVPRQHNMYSFNLENIVPYGSLACLIAKATVNESTKWHRRTKDETSRILKDFIRKIENQLNQNVKTIRCDNGTEFKNRDIIEFCGSKGIKREYSNAKTPYQNGVAERKNKTLIEAARTMLADSFLPNTFWAEVVSTACFVLNRVLVTKPQNKTPYELLTGKIPIINYLRPFGCHVTILNTIDHLGKFAEQSDKGFLVRYSLSSKAFRVYNLETKRVEENLHINFLENKPNVVGKVPTWLFDLDYLTDSMNYQPLTTENKANHTAGPNETNNSTGTQDDFDAGNSDMEANHTQEYYEELKRLKRQEKEATDAAETLRKTFAQSTKDLLLQAGAAKTNSTNFVNTATIPLNAANTPTNQDDLQIPALEDIYDHSKDGIFISASYDNEGTVADFTNLETNVNFSPIPTSRIQSIHPTTQILRDPTSTVQTRSKVNKSSRAHAFKVWILVDLPFGIDLPFRKKAIGKNRFTGIRRMKEVYVSQPPSFIDPKFPNKVYKVVKALYGLRQAPRAWYATLSTFLVKSRYKRGIIDKTLFIKKDKKDIMLVQVYVDDIIFGSTKKSWCDEFEALKKNRFQMSSMGELAFFLRLHVKQKEDGIFISQDKYVFEILKKFDFLSVKTASTPIESKKPLVKDEEAADVDVHFYRSMIGSLMKSISGGCQFLGRRLISWQRKNQTIIATSTTKAEYVAAASCCGHVLWIQNQMLDYGFNFMNTKIYIDNESTICIVKNPVFHSKTKLIEIRHHFIKDAYEKKLIQVLKIHTIS
nr:ribonuclease H-like domain-containing protein [Tanacetum cinerariifolium]